MFYVYILKESEKKKREECVSKKCNMKEAKRK